MSFYNTGNPVPSIDPRDLDDNAKHIDELTNSTFPTFVDRLGTTRKTLFGVIEDNESLAATLANPSDPLEGAAVVARVSQIVPNIAGLRALSKNSASKYAYVQGHFAPGDGGLGFYYLQEDDTASAETGLIIVATDGGRWYLNHNGKISVKQFGVRGNNTTNEVIAVQKALDAAPGKILWWPEGTYLKDARNQIHGGTRMELSPKATIKRTGTTDAWMFVNGEVGNTTYATGYDGDGDISIQGGIFDLNGFSGRSAAAFVIGHSRNFEVEYSAFKNGWESHNMEINSSANFKIRYCDFMDQGFAGASSYEVINVDYAGMAGFPAFGEWDGTPDRMGLVEGCWFKNVHSGVCSHSVPVGPEMHSRINVIFNHFEDIATKAIRGQGWVRSLITGNKFTNIGQECVSLLTSDSIDCYGNDIVGASTSSNGAYSAIRVDGNNNNLGPNNISDGGYANKYAYAYGVAAGSRNRIDTLGAARGNSGFVSDAGTLTMIDKRVLLFSGSASGAATVVTLLDSLNNYDHLEVSTGAVTGGLYQSAISRPFARRAWAVGTDYVAVTSASGRFVASVTSLTSLTITSSSDAVRHIYGVAA